MTTITPSHREKLLALVAEQLQWKGRMPFVRDIYRRLRGADFSDGEIRDMLMKVLATEYYRQVARDQPFDRARYEQGVRRLPLLPWQADESDDHGYPCDVTEDEVTAGILDNPAFYLNTVGELRERYRQLRPQLNALQNAVLKLAPSEAILASAKALGMLHQGVMVFDSEGQTAVLMDHILYADPESRCHYLEAYRRAQPQGVSEEQEVILAAMAEARYVVLRCEQTIPKTGAKVHDLLRGQSFLLLDQMLSRTAYPDALFATHVVSIDGAHLATGAGIHIADRTMGEAVNAALPPGGRSFDEQNTDGKYTTRIIRALLRHASPTRNDGGPPVSRNAPCPCGSGKKYKRCCGAR
jgi:uncharacterized protein YchJ